MISKAQTNNNDNQPKVIYKITMLNCGSVPSGKKKTTVACNLQFMKLPWSKVYSKIKLKIDISRNYSFKKCKQNK